MQRTTSMLRCVSHALVKAGDLSPEAMIATAQDELGPSAMDDLEFGTRMVSELSYLTNCNTCNSTSQNELTIQYARACHKLRAEMASMPCMPLFSIQKDAVDLPEKHIQFWNKRFTGSTVFTNMMNGLTLKISRLPMLCYGNCYDKRNPYDHSSSFDFLAFLYIHGHRIRTIQSSLSTVYTQMKNHEMCIRDTIKAVLEMYCINIDMLMFKYYMPWFVNCLQIKRVMALHDSISSQLYSEESSLNTGIPTELSYDLGDAFIDLIPLNVEVLTRIDLAISQDEVIQWLCYSSGISACKALKSLKLMFIVTPQRKSSILMWVEQVGDVYRCRFMNRLMERIPNEKLETLDITFNIHMAITKCNYWVIATNLNPRTIRRLSVEWCHVRGDYPQFDDERSTEKFSLKNDPLEYMLKEFKKLEELRVRVPNYELFKLAKKNNINIVDSCSERTDISDVMCRHTKSMSCFTSYAFSLDILKPAVDTITNIDINYHARIPGLCDQACRMMQLMPNLSSVRFKFSTHDHHLTDEMQIRLIEDICNHRNVREICIDGISIIHDSRNKIASAIYTAINKPKAVYSMCVSQLNMMQRYNVFDMLTNENKHLSNFTLMTLSFVAKSIRKLNRIIETTDGYNAMSNICMRNAMFLKKVVHDIINDRPSLSVEDRIIYDLMKDHPALPEMVMTFSKVPIQSDIDKLLAKKRKETIDIKTWQSIVGDSALTFYLNEDCWNHLKSFVSLSDIMIHNELGINETLRLFYPYNKKDFMEQPLPIGNVIREIVKLTECPSKKNCGDDELSQTD